MPLTQKCEEFFELLKYDFFLLRTEWRFYKSLFGTNAETVALLNSISGVSANTLDRVFFERTLLGLRKLTDPAQTQRGARLSFSIKGLFQFPELDERELRKLVNQAAKASSFARDWSNRRIAHNDLDYRTGGKPLEKASRLKVEEALNAISRTIKWVGTHRLDTHLVTNPIPPFNDERALLRTLYEGHRVLKERKRQKAEFLKNGEYDKVDELRKANASYPNWLSRNDPELD